MIQYVSKVTNGWYEYIGHTIIKDDNNRQSRTSKGWMIYRGLGVNRKYISNADTLKNAKLYIDNKIFESGR